MRASANPFDNRSGAPPAAPPPDGTPAGRPNGQALPSFDTLVSGLDDIPLCTDIPLPPVRYVEPRLPSVTLQGQEDSRRAQFVIPDRTTKRVLELPQFRTPDYGSPPRKRTPSAIRCPFNSCKALSSPLREKCEGCGAEFSKAEVAQRGRSLSPDNSTVSRVCQAGTSSRSSSVSISRRGSATCKPLKNPVKATKEKHCRAEHGGYLKEIEDFFVTKGWKGERALKGRNSDKSLLQFTKRDIYKKLIKHLYAADGKLNSLLEENADLREEFATLRKELETERAGNAQRRASRCYTPDSSVASSASSSPRT